MNSEERSPSIVKHEVSWDEVENWLWDIAYAIKGLNIDYIYGIPRGGLVPAVWLSHRLDTKLILKMDDLPIFWNSWDNLLIVEDVVDTGKSIKSFQKFHPEIKIVSFVRKPWAPKVLYSAHETDKWIVFPWENQ